MKIIDKYKDYYDYFQGIYRDYSIVFDRRNSVILTDKDICNQFPYISRWEKEFKDIHLLLQVGYSNWLIQCHVTETKFEPTGTIKPSDYSLELVEDWKDYNYSYPLRFGRVDKNYSIEHMMSKKFDVNSKLLDDIKHNFYEIKHIDSHSTYQDDNFITYFIFKDTKIPSIVDAFTLYQSFEEYFSHLKDDVNCDNMTDEEKIESHGFDKEYSFRSKK